MLIFFLLPHLSKPTLSINFATRLHYPTDYLSYCYGLSVTLADKQVVNQIKAQSGSVIRYKKDETSTSDDQFGYFVIGGE